MKEDEKIDEMFERFSVIVNNLDVLGKTLIIEELVIKFLVVTQDLGYQRS